jgi:hypothetical protein
MIHKKLVWKIKMEQHKPHKNLLLTQVLRVDNQFRKLCYVCILRELKVHAYAVFLLYYYFDEIPIFLSIFVLEFKSFKLFNPGTHLYRSQCDVTRCRSHVSKQMLVFIIRE